MTTPFISESCRIGKNVFIGPFAVLGISSRLAIRYPDGNLIPKPSSLPTSIGDHSYVGAHVVIEEGTTIGVRTVIDHHVIVESRSTIGDGAFLVQRAHVGTQVCLGSECVIGGLIADRSVVHDRARVLGNLLHRHEDPAGPWDQGIEGAPTVGFGAVVAHGAQVVGEVTIGEYCYVAAGAIVTRSMTPYTVATGINKFTPISQWRGKLGGITYWQPRGASQ
jgi:UDP-2-acetamido-3-amino-2,3-dideoxy-glucuronate N-acetyltransferase